MLDQELRKLWLNMAARGKPPPPKLVAEEEWGLQISWHHNEAFLGLPLRIDPNGSRKQKVFREMSRGIGKSTLVMVSRLYFAEWIAPFMQRSGLPLRAENRNLMVFGRDEPHLRNDIIGPMKKLIVERAPWLRTPKWEEYMEDPDEPDAEELTQLGDLKSRGAQKWESLRIDLANGVSIRGRTIRQSARSQHVFWADFDDILTEQNVHQSSEIMNLIRGAVMPAIEPGGLVLVDGTVQCLGDLYDLIISEGDWDCASYPAMDVGGALGYAAKNRAWLGESSRLLSDDHLSCLWPAKLPPAVLEAEKGTSMDSVNKWRREYMLERVTEETALVRSDDLMAAKDETLSYHHTRENGFNYEGGCDPSGRRQDDAAFALGTVNKAGIRYVLHLRALLANPHLKPGEGELSVVDELNALSERFGCWSWWVEANGYQGIIAALLRRVNVSIRVELFDLNVNKHTEHGWKRVRTVFQSRTIRLPYKTAEDKRITDALLHQLRGIQVIDGRIVEDPKRKNDLVSALFLFLKATDKAQADFRFTDIAMSYRPGGDAVAAKKSAAAVHAGSSELRPAASALRSRGSMQDIMRRLSQQQTRGRRPF